jgi:beta-lactamase class A
VDNLLAAAPGTVSIWCGQLGTRPPAYAWLPDVRHYAASTIKLAVLVALYRAHEAGRLDLDDEVPVRNSFRSALAGAPEFSLPPARRAGGRYHQRGHRR